MDLYDRAHTQLLALPAVQAWPAMQAVIGRALRNRNRHWRVPVLAGAAVGGDDQAAPALAAIACLHTSIILIDDLLDADPRGEYHRLGMPAAANLAVALQALGLEVLAQAPADPAARLAAMGSFNRAALHIALGQQLDTENPTDEAAYWRVVEAKSAPFFAAAMHLGAVLGGASPALAAQVERLGHLYGELIQLHDDLNDTMAVPANPDWRLGRSPLPILFAQTVEHPARERFLALRERLRLAPEGRQADDLREAQTIVIRCGGVSYALHALLQRQAAAQALLASLPLPNPTPLSVLLDEVVAPVRRLMEAVGVPAL